MSSTRRSLPRLMRPLAGAALALSAAACGPKSATTAPAGADVLVLTQPPGPFPAGVAGHLYGIDTSKPATEAVSTNPIYETGNTPNALFLEGGTLWVVDSADAKVELLRISTPNGLVNLAPATSPTLLDPGSFPEFLAPGPQGSVLVTLGAYPGRASRQVARLDASSGALEGYLTLSTQAVMAWGIASSGGRTVVVDSNATLGQNGLYVVDGNGAAASVSPVATSAPAGVAFTSATEAAVAEDGTFVGDGLIELFDVTRGEVVRTFPVNGIPSELAVAGSYVYATDLSGLTLWVLDLSDAQPSARAVRFPAPSGCSSSAGLCYTAGLRVGPTGHVWVTAWEKFSGSSSMGEVFETDAEGSLLHTYTLPEPAQDLVVRY